MFMSKRKKINRIYQGRVTKAEIPSQSKAPDISGRKSKQKNRHHWESCSDWENLLWRHHELFQDAVNYYLLAFASLATGEKRPSDQKDCPIHKLRKQMTEKWKVFNHKGGIRSGMGKSFESIFPSKQAKPLSFEKCMEKVLQGNDTDPKNLHKALNSLLKHCSGAAKIQQGGREFFPAFCLKEYTGQGAYKEGNKHKEKDQKFEVFAKNLWNESISHNKLAQNTNPEDVLNLSGKKPYEGRSLQEKLKEALNFFEERFSNDENKRQEIIKMESLIEQRTKEGLKIPSYRGGGGKTGPRSKAFILFKYIEPNATTRDFLKKTIHEPIDKNLEQKFNGKKSRPVQADIKFSDQSEKNKLNEIASYDREIAALSVNGIDPIKFSRRGERGYVFPSFTALLRDDESRLGTPLWKEFDIAAFKEALTAVNQIAQKTEDREKEKEKKQKSLDWMETRQWIKTNKEGDRRIKWQGDEDEEPEPPFIGQFEWNEAKTALEDKGCSENKSGDPRVKRLRELLERELAEEYFGEDDAAGKIPYGLRRRTLRGFGEIQKKWRKILEEQKSRNKQRLGPGEANADTEKMLEKKLKEALDAYQKKNKYSIGSAPFFNELLKPENRIIWKEFSESERKKYEESSFAENPLDALCDYYELKEEIEKLSEPVKFTPADPEHSRRLFRFGDACSWPKVKQGRKEKEAGEYGHDENSLSVRVPIMAQTANGTWEEQTIKLHYSAPRLFRDKLRKKSNESLEKAPWLQPMMKELNQSEPSQQDFWSCNVQLMPAPVKTKSGKDKKKRRFLLNFPLEIDTEDVRLSNSPVDWDKNCNDGGYKYLKWPGDKKMSRTNWFKKTDSFHCLSVDLGQRTAGAFALIVAKKADSISEADDKNRLWRFIGKTDGQKWMARAKTGGVLRLPGEDMRFFHKGKLKTEPYGSRGRKASCEELKEAENIISELCGKEAVEELTGTNEERKNLSFPELNDKLLIAVRWSQNRLSLYYRWFWMLGEESRKEKALEEIKEQEDRKDWREPAEKGEQKIQHLKILIKGEIPEFQKRIIKNLLTLAGCILPLRGKKWEWVKHPQQKDCCLLCQTDYGTDTKNKKIQGQRGLSMKRIEQIEGLRRRFQSLNQAQRRQPGSRPLKSSEMRKNPVPDPCPDLLKKLEEIKKQRVNQTAHLILAEALGVKLQSPSLSDKERRTKDIHGEYKKIRDPVDFIVIENLSRYKMKQDRAPSENRRLMQWSHRAVTNKLKELCEPYGIPVLETVAAYSSKFCARSGVPGFRAEEVTIKDKNRYPYKDWMQKEDNKDKEHEERRIFLEDLFKTLEGNKKRTGLIPKDGGPIFIPIKSPEKSNTKSGVIQADINAAINIGLRAIASPLAEEIHHRVRSERSKKGDKIIVKRSGSIEKRRYTKETEITVADGKDKLNKHSDFFIDSAKAADFEKAEIQGVKYASSKGIWTAVKKRKWGLCKAFNNRAFTKNRSGS